MAFHPLANLIDLYDGYMQTARVAGRSLLLLHQHGQTYIIENRCPHMDAPLATGTLSGESITCRAHGITFSLKTGRAGGPLADALDCLSFFEPAYEGNRVGVDL